MTSAGRRFGVLGVVACVVLLGSGFGLLHHRHLDLGDLPDSEYGRRLIAKICMLAAMGVVTGLHALWQGPRRGGSRRPGTWRPPGGGGSSGPGSTRS